MVEIILHNQCIFLKRLDIISFLHLSEQLVNRCCLYLGRRLKKDLRYGIILTTKFESIWGLSGYVISKVSLNNKILLKTSTTKIQDK